MYGRATSWVRRTATGAAAPGPPNGMSRGRLSAEISSLTVVTLQLWLEGRSALNRHFAVFATVPASVSGARSQLGSRPRPQGLFASLYRTDSGRKLRSR